MMKNKDLCINLTVVFLIYVSIGIKSLRNLDNNNYLLGCK